MTTRRPDPQPWVPGNPNDRSIRGFCIRHGSARGPLSKGKFYEMQREGIGPRLTAYGKRAVMITAADEAAWERERAEPTTTEGKLFVKEMRERRRKRALGAVEAAMRSTGFRGSRSYQPPRRKPARAVKRNAPRRRQSNNVEGTTA